MCTGLLPPGANPIAVKILIIIIIIICSYLIFVRWTSTECFPTYFDCHSAMIVEILCSDVGAQAAEIIKEVGFVFRPETK